MILAALAAAFLSVSPAQAAPAFSSTQRYAHGSVTLFVMTVDGQPHPDAVFYAGPKGQWLVKDDELYSLGRDDGWAQIRYDIYLLTEDGLSYKQDSNVLSASVTRWDDPASVGALESVIAKLDASFPKGEAELECLKQTEDWRRRWRSDETACKSLAAAEKLSPGFVRDPKELAELGPELAQAGAQLDSAKRECDYAISVQDLGRRAEMFWLSSLERSKASTTVAQSENVLQWLPLPTDQ